MYALHLRKKSRDKARGAAIKSRRHAIKNLLHTRKLKLRAHFAPIFPATLRRLAVIRVHLTLVYERENLTVSPCAGDEFKHEATLVRPRLIIAPPFLCDQNDDCQVNSLACE